MRHGLAVLVLTAALLASSPAAAQQQSPVVAPAEARERLVVEPTRVDRASKVLLPQAQEDTAASPPVSPGGAFLRSLAVPGWGQAAVGSHTRAGFYFASSAATGWMLFKTAKFLGNARERRDLVESEVEAALVRQGITDPDSLAARIEAHPRVEGLNGLVEVRSQQMEDWIAFGIFWLLLNGADAFVAAHLADFPEPVEMEFRPGGAGGRTELRFSMPMGGASP